MKHYGYQSGVFDLNHGWRFIEQDFSVLPPTREHNDVYNYAKAGGAKGPAQPSFNDSGWEEVTLPHDWVVKHDFDKTEMLNHGYKARGKGWYRNKFKLNEEDKGRQILLEFEGMSCDSQIYFNGQLVYRNFSGYQGFSVDVTDMANFGEVPNVLAVRIDASSWEGWWYEGAGIYRPVWLIKKVPVHIAHQGQWVKPVLISGNRWNVEIETELENSFGKAKRVRLQIELADRSEQVVASKTKVVFIDGFSRTIVKNKLSVEGPALWSPETPALYQCRATVSCQEEAEFMALWDEQSDRVYKCQGAAICEEETDFLITEFGFRTIKMETDTGFWLNGVNRKLKGFCNHQDHAGVGVAVPYAVKEYWIKRLKEVGADAYRCAHNVDPEMLEICDRQGMLVMEENRTFSTAKDNLTQLEGFVKNARNHPSVIFYSIFNEEPLQGTSKGRRMAQRMQALIKQLDATRPVLGAFNGGYMEEYGASSVLETVGINYNQAMYDSFHQKYPCTPLIASETSSAFAVRGEYKTDAKTHVFSSLDEDYAAWGASARDTWKWVSERPFVAGSFVWTGFDYRGEPTPYDWPSVSSFFGAFDTCGFRKALSYLYESFYTDAPMLHLEPHWSWKVSPGTSIRVMAMTNCDEVHLFLNGRQVGHKKVLPYDMAQFEIPFEPGELRAQGSIGGKAVCTDKVLTAGSVQKLLLESSKCELLDNGLDAVAVNVYAVDDRGVRVPDADNLVSFEISDGAQIIGVGNGNPNSHEPDFSQKRKLFHGCAQVIIKNSGSGDAVLRVISAGLPQAEICIKTKQEAIIPKVDTVSQQQVDGWKLYFRLFDEMPDPNPALDKNDMNSFEPVAFEGQPQPQMSGKYRKYALFRTECDLSKDGKEKVLFFGNILGNAWVYANGELIAEKKNPKEGHLLASLNKQSGQIILTVILQNMDDDWQQAGILSPAFLQ